jgi:hypothetical protein
MMPFQFEKGPDVKGSLVKAIAHLVRETAFL